MILRPTIERGLYPLILIKDRDRQTIQVGSVEEVCRGNVGDVSADLPGRVPDIARIIHLGMVVVIAIVEPLQELLGSPSFSLSLGIADHKQVVAVLTFTIALVDHYLKELFHVYLLVLRVGIESLSLISAAVALIAQVFIVLG